MDNKQRILKIVICSVVICLGFIALSMPISADVGNSFSGGGGSSGGGSYGGSYGGGGGGGLGALFFLGGGNPMILIGFGIFIVAMVFINANKQKANGNAGGVNPYSNSGFAPNRAIDEGSVIARIQEIDPNFSAEHFKTYASEVYLSVQEAWERKEWSVVRPFESNALFNVHNRQLKEYIDAKKTNYLNMQNIRNITLANFKVDGEREVLKVKLDASLLDYVLDDTSGAVIEGSKTQYQHRSYALEFIRTTGVLSDTTKDINTTNCPNCGAPTKVTSSGECEYCKSIITTGEFGWVLNQYTKW